MSQMEVTPEVFTADYVGEPGKRAFYLQARGDAGVMTCALEKQQVAALADKLRELLLIVDGTDTVKAAAPARDPALALEPAEPLWRVGAMGLAYEEGADRVIVLAQPVSPEEEEPKELEEDDEGIRFLLRRDQARSFVLHAVAIVDEGRPTCQLCGLPIDPEGHNCPASNGHRQLA
jgi:uncharacterized repeat protein (TIGR03847 family)